MVLVGQSGMWRSVNREILVFRVAVAEREYMA